MNENGDLSRSRWKDSFWRVLRNAIAGAAVVPIMVFAGGTILNAFGTSRAARC